MGDDVFFCGGDEVDVGEEVVVDGWVGVDKVLCWLDVGEGGGVGGVGVGWYFEGWWCL